MLSCNEIFHNIPEFDLEIFPSKRDGEFSLAERFNGTSSSLIECQEYKEERKNFESEMIKRIGTREWEEIKQSEDKGMKEILGLGDYGQKTTDITKKYLNTIWQKRLLTNKGQKNNISETNRAMRTQKQKIKGIIIMRRKIKG